MIKRLQATARTSLCGVIWLYALVCFAQSSAGELLNSERIELQFGSYGIEVLASDDELRVSDLYSVDSVTGERTTRTIAIVRYPPAIAAAFAGPHRLILGGGSIGATFRAAGWSVSKSHRYFGRHISSPAIERIMRLDDTPAKLAAHAYELEIERDGQRFVYATILEIHHPAYLSLAGVRRIYAPDWDERDNDDVAPLLDALAARGY